MNAAMMFGVLGPVVVRLPSGVVDVGEPRRRAVLGALLLDHTRAVRPWPRSALLRQALGLWRGPALADVGDEGLLARVGQALDNADDSALERATKGIAHAQTLTA